jgi:hypothetical protein
MTLQDFFPADLMILGLQNRYTLIGKDSFFVQSDCIVAQGKILTRQKHYIIIDKSVKSRIKMTEVILIDVFYYKGNIYLIVQDINTRRIYRVSFSLERPESNCTKHIVDIDYFTDRLDAKAIRDYCGCCDNQRQPISKGRTLANDDLLEFEF